MDLSILPPLAGFFFSEEDLTAEADQKVNEQKYYNTIPLSALRVETFL
jgi:hypothetical protein